jgi:DNA polymerase-3 subunit delta|tara:strand:+ start:287 stop:1282 length:996 start_codon:yes stop_codon:yes gene_type:complete
MIIKSFDFLKTNLSENHFFLLYGENEGHKKEIIEEKFKKSYTDNIYTYEESEILQNTEAFFNDILSRSFFENDKLIIISRVTDKINNLIEEILEKKIEDLVVILNAGTLEKKSKLRSLFEKDKKIICVPFYEDNNQTLSGIVNRFFRENKISISQQLINLVVQRCRGDRQNLKNELEKIKNYSRDKSKINLEELLKLTNLAENYSVSELIDSCLSKNKKKTVNILNENNYSVEDCILIIRTFLIKSKRLLRLVKEVKNSKNIDSSISSFKPPIFWKDKEIVKQQIKNWSQVNTESLLYKITETELLIKKNSNSSINILSNFIIEQATAISN